MSISLQHVFELQMGVVAKFNILFLDILAIKDISLENILFSRISLDFFSPSSRAFRQSSSTSGDAITPD